MNRTRSLATALTASVALLALAACGSTVQVDANTTTTGSLGAPVAGGTGADGSALGVPGGSGGTGGSGLGGSGGGSGLGGGGSVPGSTGGGVPGGTVPGGTSPDGGTPSGDPSTDPGGGGGGGGSLGGDSSGVIQVGVTYVQNGGAANAAIGASALTTGDDKANNQAVIDDINEHGGINGRKLSPVFFGYDAQSSQTGSAQDQAACSQFTEDNHVAVVLGQGLTETLDACLFKAGILEIASGVIIKPDATYLRTYSSRYQLGTLTQDRMMADQVTTLKRLNYFSGWSETTGAPSSDAPKIGIISQKLPEWERPLKSVLLPALARAGYQVDPQNIYAVQPASTTGEVAGTATDIQNATLRLKTSGVNHVIMLDANGLLTILFSKTAGQQAYYPRLGMNSGTGAQALFDAGVVTAKTLTGAVGLGWLPNLDIPARAGAAYNTPATKKCLALIKAKTGQNFTSSNAAGIALSACDGGWLMAAALRGAGDNPTLASAEAAISRLGGSYASPFIPQTFFSSTRHDAAQLGFDMVWSNSCSCTQYVGKHTIP